MRAVSLYWGFESCSFEVSPAQVDDIDIFIIIPSPALFCVTLENEYFIWLLPRNVRVFAFIQCENIVTCDDPFRIGYLGSLAFFMFIFLFMFINTSLLLKE